MGVIELLKEMGDKISSALKVTFSNQDIVGEDVIENLELAILTTPGVDNKEGSELIKTLRDVEKRNKKERKNKSGKDRASSSKGKGGKGISRANMQDETMKTIKDGVTTNGKYDESSVQTKDVTENEEKSQREHEGH